MNNKSFEVIILGGGMVGMSIAHQLKERGISEEILIIEKEKEIGKYSSQEIVVYYMLVFIIHQIL